MKYLLDTHILLWLLTDNPKLNPAVKAVLMDSSHSFYFSTESVREIINHLLICQAIAENITLISADRNFPFYRAQGLKLLVNEV